MEKSEGITIPHEKPWRYEEGEYTVTRGSAWSGPGCHLGCGVLMYTDKDGKLVKVEGDPDNPFNQGALCMRCLEMPEFVNNPTRLGHPMKRAGERGENKWERVSWEEALDLIEEKVRAIWKDYGPESIVCHIGTGRNNCDQIPYLCYAAFGSPNFSMGYLAGDSCFCPRSASMASQNGDFMIADCSQQFEKRYDESTGWRCPEVIVNWGCNAVVSNSDNFFGGWIVDCMQRGSKMITIDPSLTWLASRSAYWLRVRPGTDAALAMAMLNVIISEDLYDHDFVAKWCYGFDELAERVRDWTPERAAEVCCHGVCRLRRRRVQDPCGRVRPQASFRRGLGARDRPCERTPSACRTSACARADVRGIRGVRRRRAGAFQAQQEQGAVRLPRRPARCGSVERADSARCGITCTTTSRIRRCCRPSLRTDEALREVGAEQTVVRRRNHLSVRSSMIECDYYRLLEGDSALKGVPLGPYLPDYAWASKTAAALERAR